MLALFVKNPLLLLFIVSAVGYLFGHLKIKGVSLGVAAVLFVGLAVGAIDPALKAPDAVGSFGLAIFLYALGLSSGPSFFTAFKKDGIRELFFVCSSVAVASLVTFFAIHSSHLNASLVTGIFTGAMTCTPALAAVLDHLKAASSDMSETALALPVVGYSLAYPMSVFGAISTLLIWEKIRKIHYEREVVSKNEAYQRGLKIDNRTILVAREEACRVPLLKMQKEQKWDVTFSRVAHHRYDDDDHAHEHGHLQEEQTEELVKDHLVLRMDDLIVAVGPVHELDRVTHFLGKKAEHDLTTNRTFYDLRRLFVSNVKIVGKRLCEHDFLKKNDILVTRIRRGDVEILPDDSAVLQLGDTVRVICSRTKVDTAVKFFGDSYRAVSEIDIVSFCTGLALGTLVGLIIVPVGGGITFTLGFAGGPLVVGLVLGRLHRTGPIVWGLPYGAVLMLRQLGLVLFLSTVGLKSGYAFFQTIKGGDGLILLGWAYLVTVVTMLFSLWLGYDVFKISMSRLSGMIGGLFTQSAILGFAVKQSKSEVPNSGFAMVYPIATIVKILVAQLILQIALRNGSL